MALPVTLPSRTQLHLLDEGSDRLRWVLEEVGSRNDNQPVNVCIVEPPLNLLAIHAKLE